jgi:hypothetical protein
MEEVVLSKFYENTREQRVRISRRMHRAPFSKFRIPTTLHHRLAGSVVICFVNGLRFSGFSVDSNAGIEAQDCVGLECLHSVKGSPTYTGESALIQYLKLQDDDSV